MSLFSSAAKTLKEFKGTALNTSIAVMTIIVEEILNRTVYYCPCVELSELNCGVVLSSNSANSSAACTFLTNRYYGLSFIIAPTIALFLLMSASSPKLWKTWTGCCKKNVDAKRPFQMIIWTLSEIFGRALIAPITWLCFALLDGKYYACASTPLPYPVDISSTYKSCSEVVKSSTPTMSDAYRDNRSLSQIYGWIAIACAVFVGFTAYAISRCIYPLTYYHAKYFKLYRDFEESEFDDEMKKKAQKQAESNILKFMSKDRSKSLWDRISTVFSFHRNPKNKALYSYLHEFILEEEGLNPPAVSGESGTSDVEAPKLNTDTETTAV